MKKQFRSLQKFNLILTILFLVFGSSYIAQSQEYQSHLAEARIPGTNPLELLKLAQVQQELKLTPEQINQLRQIDQEFRSQAQSPGTQNEQRGREQIAEVLEPRQLNRFKEITLQIYGWGVMSEEEVTEILVLSPEQQKRLEKIRANINQKVKELWQITRNNQSESCYKNTTFILQEMIELTEESNEQTLKVLEEDQRQILEYMKGEEFILDLNKIQPLCYEM